MAGKWTGPTHGLRKTWRMPSALRCRGPNSRNARRLEVSLARERIVELRSTVQAEARTHIRSVGVLRVPCVVGTAITRCRSRNIDGPGFLEDMGLYMRLDPTFGAQIHPASEERGEFFFKGFLVSDKSAKWESGRNSTITSTSESGRRSPRAADPKIAISWMP